MKNFVCCGMQYGDEGKGSFSDWLTFYKDADCIVKYNGGSQASHTVQTDSGPFKFAQLGSGMFNGKKHSVITNMVVNPENLMREIEEFSKMSSEAANDILSRVHIKEDCFVVTRYHKLMNWLRELSLGENRRGSVGTGVSEVPVLKETGLGITIGELQNESIDIIKKKMFGLYDYTLEFYANNRDAILENCPGDMKDGLLDRIRFYLYPQRHADVAEYMYNFHHNVRFNLFDDIKDILDTFETVVWEGSQGFLIDKDYGIYPNTTKLTTTNVPTIKMTYGDVIKVGITKAFCSRHGRGIFVTADKALGDIITDENQSASYWNGEPRYGWFDAVMFNYANSVNKVDVIAMSAIDQLTGFKEVKICTKYLYEGEMDEEFKDSFIYELHDDIFIVGIKKNNHRMKEWLLQCMPVYETMRGWEKTMDEDCMAYIRHIEEITGVPVGVVSVGPSKKDKIVLAPEALVC